MIVHCLTKADLAKQSVITSLYLLLTAGCSISVPQAESSYRFVKDLVSPDNISSRAQQSVWLASVDNRGAVLRPYRSGGLTVFANSDGDAIAFDGWIIRSIVGFGLTDPLSISGKDGKRTFLTGGVISSIECDPWDLNGLTWNQMCAIGNGQIVLDPDGNIEVILMSLGENLGIVTLRLAK